MEAAAYHQADLEVARDTQRFAERGVELFIADAQKAIKARGKFYIAISGGCTLWSFLKLIAKSPEIKSLPWSRIHLFWVDEQLGCSGSEGTNYKLVTETFLSAVSIPQRNVHRIPTELCDLQAAAESYERSIREVFGLKQGSVPGFDLIILGMGNDGSIASFYCDCYATFERERLTCVVYDLGERFSRITLSPAVLCAANHLIVLVSGKDKADVLREVMTTEPDEVRYPIHILWPVLNKVTWLVDKEAARAL